MFRSNSQHKKKSKSSENRYTVIGTSLRKSDIDSFPGHQKINSNSVENYIIPDYDENFVSPSVRVKHSINYEYDDKKFELIEGELLFLINKTNQDWWLCLRLDENLTFFAPASYVQELENRPQPNLVPPPRPPPPPPCSSVSPNLNLRASQRSNAAMTAAARAAAAATSPVFVDYSFSSPTIESQLTKTPSKPEVKQRQNLNYRVSGLIEDQSYLPCLVPNKRNNLINSNSTISRMARIVVTPDHLSDESIDSIIHDLDDRLNKEEDLNIYTTIKNFKSDQEDSHIYENCSVEQRELSLNKDLGNQQASMQPLASISNYDEENEHELNGTKINDDLEKYLRIQDEESLKSEDDLLELESIKTPCGWKIFTHGEQRYFFNEHNDDKWYVTQDINGKHYFYNAEGKSVWELNEIDEDQDHTDEHTPHFRKDFDKGLDTFKLIHSRLSVRRPTETPKNTNDFCLNRNISYNQRNSGSFLHSGSTGLCSNFRCVKIVEKGKKCKKKIVEQFEIELASPKMLFIKEVNGQKKLELPIDLKGARCYKIEIPKSSDNKKDTNNNLSKNDKVKIQIKIPKKNCEIDDLADFIGSAKNGFLIETSNGYKILIIHEDETVINEWVTEINLIISQNASSSSLAQSPIYSTTPILKNVDFKVPRSVQTVNNSKKGKFTIKNFINDMRKNSKDESELPPLPKLPPPQIINENTINIYKTNVIKEFLSAFLRGRSTYADLKKAGIIKECVFGSNLINLCHKERRIVPLFVEEITKAIENKGLDMDGIYRISGNLAEVQKLRLQVHQGKYNFMDFEIHVLCGAFKTFFRELEEPLIPFIMHEDFLYSLTIPEKPKRIDAIHELIKTMPITHRETMRHLCQHLLRVVEKSDQNRMTLQNLALVYGPNIVRSNPINDTNTGFNPNIMTQNLLVEFILKNFNELYSYTPTTVFYESGN